MHYRRQNGRLDRLSKMVGQLRRPNISMMRCHSTPRFRTATNVFLNIMRSHTRSTTSKTRCKAYPCTESSLTRLESLKDSRSQTLSGITPYHLPPFQGLEMMRMKHRWTTPSRTAPQSSQRHTLPTVPPLLRQFLSLKQFLLPRLFLLGAKSEELGGFP